MEVRQSTALSPEDRLILSSRCCIAVQWTVDGRRRQARRLSPFPVATAEGRVAPTAVRAIPGVEDGGLALPHLKGTLRFAAHDNYKIGILASLDAQALI